MKLTDEELSRRLDLDIIDNFVELIKKVIPDWSDTKENEFRELCYNRKERIQDFIDTYSVDEIVQYMELDDILDNFSKEEIMDELDQDEMAYYLDRHCYDFSEFVDDNIDEDDDEEPIYDPGYCLSLLRQSLSSRPFLVKEDLKNVINEYIDSLPNVCY